MVQCTNMHDLRVTHYISWWILLYWAFWNLCIDLNLWIKWFNYITDLNWLFCNWTSLIMLIDLLQLVGDRNTWTAPAHRRCLHGTQTPHMRPLQPPWCRRCRDPYRRNWGALRGTHLSSYNKNKTCVQSSYIFSRQNSRIFQGPQYDFSWSHWNTKVTFCVSKIFIDNNDMLKRIKYSQSPQHAQTHRESKTKFKNQRQIAFSHIVVVHTLCIFVCFFLIYSASSMKDCVEIENGYCSKLCYMLNGCRVDEVTAWGYTNTT